MPIYKIPQSEKVISAKGHPHSHASGASWSDGPAEHSHGTAGKMTFMEMTEADREQERPLSGKVEAVTTLATPGHTTQVADHHHSHHHQHHHDGRHSLDEVKAETIITREIRQQREREEELEAMHRALHLTLKHEEHSMHHAHHPSHEIKVTAGSHDKGAGSSSHHVVTVSGAPHDKALGSSNHVVSRESHDRDARSSVDAVKVMETGHHAEHKHVTHPDVERSKVATGGKRSSGESRISEELMEQRQKEEELRRYRKEIGIEVDADYTDSGLFLLDTPSTALHQHHHQESRVIVKEGHGGVGHSVSKGVGSGHHPQHHGSHTIVEGHGGVGHSVSKEVGSGHHPQHHGSHMIVEGHGGVGHSVSKGVGSGHHPQPHGSHMIVEGHGGVGYSVSKEVGLGHHPQHHGSHMIVEGHGGVGHSASKEVGLGHHPQHHGSHMIVEGHGGVGHSVSKEVGSGHHPQHHGSHMIVEGHCGVGHSVSKEVGSGHHPQHHGSHMIVEGHGGVGHSVSKEVGYGQHSQHQASFVKIKDVQGMDAMSRHDSSMEIGIGHHQQQHTSYITASHPVSKDFGAGQQHQQQHQAGLLYKMEGHSTAGYPLSKEVGPARNYHPQASYAAGHLLSKGVGSANQHQQQHLANHATGEHLLSKEVGPGHNHQHQTSHAAGGHLLSKEVGPGHSHQHQTSHATGGHLLSKEVGPGHNHQHQTSHTTGGHLLSKEVGPGHNHQHQTNHTTGGHLLSKEVGPGHQHQHPTSHATGGHLLSKEVGSGHQHQHQHGHHLNLVITKDGHGMDAANRHQSIPQIGTGHHHELSHQAIHYDDDGYHLTNDTITGHHSSTNLKRSISAPVIPALEAIHFDHIKPYTPHNESLMEREIKMAREREEALRLVRGLGPLAYDVVHEIEVATPHPRFEDQHNPEELSRKYAENRLRTELQREKQREVDLLKLGMIQSLSEHRKGEPVRYVGRISSETEELRDFSRSRSIGQREISRDHSLLSPSPTMSVDIEHKTVVNKVHNPKASFEVEVKGHKGNIEVEAKGPKGHFEIESKGHKGNFEIEVKGPKGEIEIESKGPSGHFEIEVKGPRGEIEIESKGPKGHFEIEAKGPKGHAQIESKGHHAALHNMQPISTVSSSKGKDHSHVMAAHTFVRTSHVDGTERQQSTRTPADKLIEMEVAEAKRRESELRELRKSLLLEVGAVHSHELKDHKGTHRNVRAAETGQQHGHATPGHAKMEVHTEVRDLHDNGAQVSLHRQGSDDSGQRSPESPNSGKFALIDEWEIKNTRSPSP